MRTILHTRKSLSFLGISAFLGLTLASCSSTQPYIDTDGVYNSEKVKPVETHNQSEYYSKYFKEKKQEADYFTDIDNYNSYTTGAPGWGENDTNVVVYNYYGGFYNSWYDPWYYGWGWISPYWGWNSYWGWDYPYYGWGGYYGWYSPYYCYYGWGYPYYRSWRNISYSSNHRTVSNRVNSASSRITQNRTYSRQLNNSTLANSRNISTARMSTTTREINTPTRDNTNRTQRIESSRSTRYDSYRTSTPTRTSSPSSGRSISTGSSGGRSISTGGGRR